MRRPGSARGSPHGSRPASTVGSLREGLRSHMLSAAGLDSKASTYAPSVCSTASAGAPWKEGLVSDRIAGAATAAGMDMGSTKTNQDSSFLLGQGGGDFFCGVIDGHGASGHHVSSFVKSNLAQRVLEQRREQSHKGTRAALMTGFVETADKLTRTRAIDSKESGAVVAVCMRKGQDLYAANVGDTRAVLVSADDTGRVRSQPLTRDHTPALAGERERIAAKGGEVAPTFIPGQGFAGPPRVWQQKQVSGGLCVTRAIGDSSLNSVGVTAQPEVVKHRLRPTDKYVVLASDGCWDYVSNDRAAEIVMKQSTPKAASEAIVKEARRNWQMDRSRRGYIDDITCLVAKV